MPGLAWTCLFTGTVTLQQFPLAVGEPRYNPPVTRILLITFLAAFSALAQSLDGFDQFMAETMARLNVPGAAAGVIQDGKVVLAKGYGVRAVNAPDKVTPQTLFAIGSVTKSFTSAALATLVDEGKLDWDKPVREYLPWFRLYDPHATELITLRDMLTHRSGLPRYDSMRFLVKFPMEELVRRLQYLPPSLSFREAYQYNNLMYVTAGFIGARVNNSSFEDLVRTRVFRPLEMTASTVTVKDSQKAADFARPHELQNGKPTVVPFYDYQEFGVGPNGFVNSNVDDMLRYLRFYLDGGKVGGRQVISEAQMRQLRQPVISAGPGTATYALGWNVSYYEGRLRIGHGGAITGFTANVALFPDQKIGIVVLNNGSSPLPDIATRALANRMLGIKPRERRDPAPQPPAADNRPKPTPGTKPSLDAAAYAGSYHHPAYGTIRVQNSSGELDIVFPSLTARLRHFHYDTFTAPRLGLVRFSLDETGKITTMHLPVEQAVKPLPFERLP